MRRQLIGFVVTAVLCAAAMTADAAASGPATSARTLTARPDHVVVVMMENHSYSDVIGSSAAPYLNSLARQGASFNHSYAITHPSEPNYLALFSGSTQGVTNDSCPHTFSTANLGRELIAAGDTFAGYSDGMPGNGYSGCSSGDYARKHNPWSNFTDVPSTSNLTYTEFPHDYSKLPTVSFVIPNLQHDMHDGTVQQGDTWLRDNIDAYVQWAKTHNSVLVVTWDEDDNSADNQIPTIFVGAGITHGSYSETINHYSVLRTLEDLYRLPHAGASATARPITDIWSKRPASTPRVQSPCGESSQPG